MEYRNLIYNLDALGKLKTGDKVIIRDGVIILNLYSLGRPLYRFNNGEGREKTYLFILRLFDDLDLEISKYINFINNNSNLYASEINIKTIFELEEIKKKISFAKKGIDNLKKTYQKDKPFCRKIELLLKKNIFNF